MSQQIPDSHDTCAMPDCIGPTDRFVEHPSGLVSAPFCKSHADEAERGLRHEGSDR